MFWAFPKTIVAKLAALLIATQSSTANRVNYRIRKHTPERVCEWVIRSRWKKANWDACQALIDVISLTCPEHLANQQPEGMTSVSIGRPARIK